MEDPKETLRKVLCDDNVLNDAVEILERLVKLEDKKVENWHCESAVIERDSKYQTDILGKLRNGGLVSRALVGFEPSYAITKNGRELYSKYNNNA